MGLGVGPRIRYTLVREKCSQVAIQSTLKKQDFGFCKSIESLGSLRKKTKILKGHKRLPRKIIGNSQKPKRKFVRRSTTFTKWIEGLPQVKRPSKAKCSCFICGDPKHFANAYPNRQQKSHNQEIINDNFKIYKFLTNFNFGPSNGRWKRRWKQRETKKEMRGKILILFISVFFYNNRASVIYNQEIHILTNCTCEATRLERKEYPN